MYLCVKCNSLFDKLAIYQKQYETNNFSSGFSLKCPSCGNTDLAEAKICVGCGDYINSVSNDCNLCPDCKSFIVRKFSEFLEDVFSTNEINFLNALLQKQTLTEIISKGGEKL